MKLLSDKRMKLLIVISISLFGCSSSFKGIKEVQTELKVQELRPKNGLFISVFDSLIRLNENCNYTKVNPVFYFNMALFLQEHDTILTFNSVAHDLTGYHEDLKPDVVLVHNGIRFYIRFTEEIERSIIEQHFAYTDKYINWKVSKIKYPLYVKEGTMIQDGTFIKAIFSKGTIKILQVVNCEMD
jgi:hypothetical protein